MTTIVNSAKTILVSSGWVWGPSVASNTVASNTVDTLESDTVSGLNREDIVIGICF